VLLPEIAIHAGRFCEVATRHGVYYGEIVRLSAVLFLVRPRLLPAAPPRTVCAGDIVRITPLPDPR
jgi:hypothetical protein